MLCSLVLLAGCMSFSDRSLRPLQQSLIEQLPYITLENKLAIQLGSGMLNMLDVVTLNDANLSVIDHVQLAVYQVHGQAGTVDFSDDVFAQSLRDSNAELDWDRIVRVRDNNEQVWIYAGMNLRRESLEALSVFIWEQDELVLINLDGDLDSLLQYAMASARGDRIE
jgi:hypothetical protein